MSVRRRRPRLVHLPGPRLPPAAQTLLFLLRPLEFAEAMRRRHGPCFRLDTALFGEMAYLSDPEAIRAVFTGGAEVYRAGEGNALLRPILGERSLLLLDGDEHLEQRRLLLPPFHGEAVRRYEREVAAIAAREVASWPAGVAFPARPRLQAIALEVILRVVLGVRDARRRAALRALLPRLLDIRPRHLALLAMWPGLVDSPLRRVPAPTRVRERVDALLREEIAERRARAGGAADGDVLSLLAAARDEDGRALDDEELRDHVVTLLLAGHETTATALSWALERLVRHPRVLARLRAEIAGGHGEAYLDAVCREVLRVRPVVMDVVRRVTRPVELAGGRIEPGALAVPSIALAHLREESWPEPHAFRPERFLDGGGAGAYTWLPFGGGARRCLGASFALMEMRTVLRAVMAGVEPAATSEPGEPARLRHVTLVPARGGRVTVARR